MLSSNEQFFLNLMEKADIPGLSIASINSEGTISSLALGTTDKGHPWVNVVPETVFEAASLSKPVFAYLVLKLVEQGYFKLNTPFSEILGERLHKILEDMGLKKEAGAFNAQMVLSHQTGLPNNELAPTLKPFEQFSYSGIAYFYLQKVIETLTGESLEELAKKYVFDPIVMESSSFRRPDPNRFRIAVPHDDKMKPQPHTERYDLCLMSDPKRERGKLYINSTPLGLEYEVIGPDKELKKATIYWDNLKECPRDVSEIIKSKNIFLPKLLELTLKAGHTPDPACAANSLHTTANDYARFIKVWMKESENNETLRAAFNPVVSMMKDNWAIEEKVPSKDLKKLAWGLGWALQGSILFHWGDIGDIKLLTAFDIENGVGIVCFGNSWNFLSIAQDIVSSIGIDLGSGFKFLYGKYGYKHHNEKNWKQEQNYQTVANHVKYERSGFTEGLPERFKRYLESKLHINPFFVELSSTANFAKTLNIDLSSPSVILKEQQVEQNKKLDESQIENSVPQKEKSKVDLDVDSSTKYKSLGPKK